MNRTAVGVLLAAGLLLPGAASAQTFKCLDKAGKTTYTNGKCSELGLRDAGEVPDHLNVNPAYQPPPVPPSRPSRSAPQPGRGAADGTDAPRRVEKPAAPAEPERHCFVVRTPSGGTVTRCNDKPDE